MSWKPVLVDLSTDSTTVTAQPAVVKGIYINTALSAHACSINDGTTTVFIIKASTAAGTIINFAGEDGVLFENNVIVDPDNSATGSITVLYKNRIS